MNSKDAGSQGRGRRRGALRLLEALCWTVALALVLPQLTVVAARESLTVSGPAASWSEGRRSSYARLLMERSGLPAPIGTLELRGREVRLPVYSGTGEAALTLGAGHLPETAALDGEGNIAVAGHRDGYFRELSHVSPGDELVLTVDGRARTFEVVDLRVVAPRDVWVLDPTEQTTLTLITCHPFYFVGHAPDRFVVRAQLASAAAATVAAASQVSQSLP